MNDQPTKIYYQGNFTAVLSYTVDYVIIKIITKPIRSSQECHLLLQHHVEVVKVTVAPTDVPLHVVLAAIILLCNTDEVNCILHAMLRTRTCQTRLNGSIIAVSSHKRIHTLIQNGTMYNIYIHIHITP